MTGVTVRTLRNYVTAGLITPLERRGTSTRYSRRELLRLLAVMRGQKSTKLTLAAMKTQLDAIDDAGLEAWLRNAPLPPLAAEALGIAPLPAAPTNSTQLDPALERFRAQLQTWQRVQLLPGLELVLGPELSAAAAKAAAKICADYLG